MLGLHKTAQRAQLVWDCGQSLEPISVNNSTAVGLKCGQIADDLRGSQSPVIWHILFSYMYKHTIVHFDTAPSRPGAIVSKIM